MGTNRNQWHRIFLLGVCLGLTSFQVQCQKNEEDQTTKILAGTVLAYQAATTITCTSEQLTKTHNLS
ncbi:hypothetical protein [Leptospira meyeri]|uniref:hypothetical protein n=1 Tax=Leptospira meyeri TaxID=29508 RepID=UPI001FF001B0|nr:hypothetical protein [Leptospira meyeri]